MIKIKLHNNDQSFMPIKGSEEAACYDVFAREIIDNGNGFVKVKLGIYTEIPLGYKAVLVARSSITGTGWFLANCEGIIDSDFRNEWQARFQAIPNGTTWELVEVETNCKDCGEDEVEVTQVPTVVLTFPEFPYKVGERVAQFSIEKVLEYDFEVVSELNDSKRGLGGFGSSGK